MTPVSKAIWTGFILIVIAIGGLFLFKSPAIEAILEQLGLIQSGVKYRASNNPYKVLHNTNGAFAAGDTQLKLKNATSAISYFEQALSVADDKAQVDQIRFKIAYAEQLRGNKALAIQKFKELANDRTALPLARAYAIEDIALLYSEPDGRQYRDEIFKDEPFNQIYAKGDDALSLRKLYEMAASIYPLALAELNAADWYISALEHAYKVGTGLTEDQKNVYLSTVQQDLAAADKDLEKRQDDPNITSRINQAYLEEAVIKRSLAVMGVIKPEEADAAFKKALSLYSTKAGAIPSDGRARFQYARFLVQVYGASRAQDVKDTLSPIYTDKRYASSTDMAFFKDEKNNLNGRKKYLVEVSAVDPDFKKLLLSLGWAQSDFAVKPSKPR